MLRLRAADLTFWAHRADFAIQAAPLDGQVIQGNQPLINHA